MRLENRIQAIPAIQVREEPKVQLKQEPILTIKQKLGYHAHFTYYVSNGQLSVLMQHEEKGVKKYSAIGVKPITLDTKLQAQTQVIVAREVIKDYFVKRKLPGVLSYDLQNKSGEELDWGYIIDKTGRGIFQQEVNIQVKNKKPLDYKIPEYLVQKKKPAIKSFPYRGQD